MNELSTLTTALLDLVGELEGGNVPLIIGGGFGVYLRYQQAAREHRETMFVELPEPRSTNDLDVFLRAELLLDSSRLKPLRDALNRLGYDVVKGAEHYQFARPGPGGDKSREVRIDVLTGPTRPFKGSSVKYDDRRVRPTPSVKLHAHPVEEALTLTEGTSPWEISGTSSDGKESRGTVLLPHPFAFLTMKLFALRDQIDDAESDFGRRHALDLYAVVGSTARGEWDQCLAMRASHRNDTIIVECGRIVTKLFASADSLGTLRLRESPYFRAGFDVDGFLSALKDLFVTGGS